jgi:protein phosphatase
VASRLAVGSFVSLDKTWISSPLADAVRGAVRDGEQRIAFVSASRPRHRGMATTLTAVAAGDDGSLVVANVGDSRAYLRRDGALRRLTRDDSFVQELLDAGQLSPEDARTHPGRSIVLAALDGSDRAEPRLTELSARCGDRLMLCSDGLSDAVDDEVIARILRERDRIRCARRLVRAAIARASADNVSVIVADVVPRAERTPGWTRPGA